MRGDLAIEIWEKHDAFCPRIAVLFAKRTICNMIVHSVDPNANRFGENKFAQGKQGVRKLAAEQVRDIILECFPFNEDYQSEITKELMDVTQKS